MEVPMYPAEDQLFTSTATAMRSVPGNVPTVPAVVGMADGMARDTCYYNLKSCKSEGPDSLACTCWVVTQNPENMPALPWVPPTSGGTMRTPSARNWSLDWTGRLGPTARVVVLAVLLGKMTNFQIFGDGLHEHA